ncbi:hypothetical protein IEQ34_005382 [Dendrobium chrysotoxum]|uniref:Uncharacterized protein n=1 Tax=Dendrobium chrysotoxum TaxID=161865 RepID=A0AAV7HAW3_DENCH|nr:hypothetical protein IEQ34_005382 [Dendrobium chrysotoxum]
MDRIGIHSFTVYSRRNVGGYCKKLHHNIRCMSYYMNYDDLFLHKKTLELWKLIKILIMYFFKIIKGSRSLNPNLDKNVHDSLEPYKNLKTLKIFTYMGTDAWSEKLFLLYDFFAILDSCMFPFFREPCLINYPNLQELPNWTFYSKEIECK